MAFEPVNEVRDDCCCPQEPPPSTDQEPCQGTLTGSISGTVTMDCCCPRLYSRTFIVTIGPQSEGSLVAFLQNTVNSYENMGYVVLAHSLIDTGAGWVLGLSIGWYAP